VRKTVFILHPGEFVLGSTPNAPLPDDLVARLEIVAWPPRAPDSLEPPASETVMVLPTTIPNGRSRKWSTSSYTVTSSPRSRHVRTRISRDHGLLRGPPDRIFEVELASGRRVRHRRSQPLHARSRWPLAKVRTGVVKGVRAAVRDNPDPRDRFSRSMWRWFLSPTTRSSCVKGPRSLRLRATLRLDASRRVRATDTRTTTDHDRLPMHVARELDSFRCSARRSAALSRARSCLPVRGARHRICVALGCTSRNSARISSSSPTQPGRLDRVEATLTVSGFLYTERRERSRAVRSWLLTFSVGWARAGRRHEASQGASSDGAPSSQLSSMVSSTGWAKEARTSVWTTSDGLVATSCCCAPP
jgi:hypothetical protein